LAATYEPQCCKLWSKASYHLPSLEERVMVLRMLIIRLYRVTLVSATLQQVSSSNDQRIDEFFEVLTNCLDEKTFIRDYEKAYPFKQDINDLLSRGVFIDETRIDYMANAISACFHACGEDYAVEKIVVDPLYDPNFDRQLLGACSLDITGVELQSLVTQVKDILPELPDSYVEVVLKHYGYQSEVAINALLEGSVPTRLEKYKNESYVQPLNDDQVGSTDRGVGTDNALEKLASRLKIGDVWKQQDAERFYAGKRRHGFESAPSNEMAEDMKLKIKDICSMKEEPTKPTKDVKSGKKSVQIQTPNTENSKDEPYVDESLLPTFHRSLEYEYEDEYDDTYDELGVGMTEPDNYKPLNQKLSRAVEQDDDDEEESQEGKKLDLYEDPAIVRARLERRREDKMQHHQRRGPGPPPQAADVVGKAKGQGQDKDVLYARRQKTANKDSGGYKKKRADFKRREF
ncbi:Activating signal cointegrator 1 complex subunit 2, partial [Orchesella cincta]